MRKVCFKKFSINFKKNVFHIKKQRMKKIKSKKPMGVSNRNRVLLYNDGVIND